MLKLGFIIVVIVHGLIHLLGFIKAFDFSAINQITKSVSKPLGMLWLVAAILFGITVTLFILKKDLWWLIGILSILVSQLLILLYWQDAKFGTLANIVVTFICVIGYGEWSFNKMVERELVSFLPQMRSQTDVIDEKSIEHLPASVKQWLNVSSTIGENKPQVIHLFQSGRMKTEIGGNWLSVNAEQWFTPYTPGFVWKANVGKGSMMQFSGRDKYKFGQGAMLIKLYALFPVVKADGQKINQGAAVRYLAETIWFPSAALSEFIEWEETGLNRAKATMTHGEVIVEGEFTFNEQGHPVSFIADRFYDKTGKLERWLIEIDEKSYRSFNGRIVPTKANVTWKLKDGDFTWYELEVENIEYE